MKTAAMKLRLIGNAVADLDPEDDRLGHAVDDRADDDAHGAAHARFAEARLHRPCRRPGRRPRRPASTSANCQRSSTSSASTTRSKEIAAISAPAPKPARMPTIARGHVEPAGEQAGKQQGRRSEQAEAECLKHASRRPGRRLLVDRLDLQRQPVHRDHADARAGRKLGARASLPELTQDADVARGSEPLRHLAGCADELLDACLNLPAPHPALPVHDLDDADRDAREPADDVPRRGQDEEEHQSDQEEQREPPRIRVPPASLSRCAGRHHPNGVIRLSRRSARRPIHPLWAMRRRRAIKRITRPAEPGGTMADRSQLRRDVLPIPDITPVGLTTYDAKDPATSFPPIEPLRPPEGAPNVLVILIDDVGFAASSAFGGPINDAECRAARRQRPQVQPLPHDRALLADAPGPAHGTEPPRGRDGRHHRDRHLGARLQLDPAEHVRAARRDAEAERLLDGAVRQVPRGAGLGDEPDGAVQRLADRLAASSTSTASSAARRTSTRRRSTATRSRSSSRRRPRRATTSPRT